MKLLLFALLAATPLTAQDAAPPAPETLAFSVDHQGTTLPSFTLTVHPDGNAVYQASYPAEPPKYSPYAAPVGTLPNTDVTLKVQLSHSGTAALFARAREANGFAGGCNSKAKNIANTGKKTLTYTTAAGEATCTYNYPDDKNVVYLTNTFQAIAYTLDAGRKLENRHKYDRLALDPETDYLVTAAKRGDAMELGTIAPILQVLVDDPQVLERVLKRAANLLAQATQNQ
jgi:hypothetical protein